MENKIFRKTISVNRVFCGFDSEIGLHFYFHFKPFPDSSNAQREREREKKETSSLDPPITPIHLIHPHRSKHRWVAPCPLARSCHEPTHLVHRRDRTTNPPTDRPTSSTSEIAPRTHEPIDPPSEWPTPRSTHHLQIDPPRPSASHTHKPIFLCPSLTIGLVILIFCFDFWFLCCLYILILCNNICLDPKKMLETWKRWVF